jgi:hypothetical protein
VATDRIAVSPGVRNTLALLARIHAELDAAQPSTATRPSLTEHVAPLLGAPKRAQRRAAAQPPATLKEAS